MGGGDKDVGAIGGEDFFEAMTRLEDECDDVDLPQETSELFCPLSYELLRDPVRADDGYVYERAHLLKWLSHTPNHSPMTGLPFTCDLEVAQDMVERVQRFLADEQELQAMWLHTQGITAVVPDVLKKSLPFRHLLEKMQWQLPQMVFIGGESAGKTTLLVRIVRKHFLPIAPTCATRMPTRIVLKQGPSESATLAVVDSKTRQVLEPAEACTIPRLRERLLKLYGEDGHASIDDNRVAEIVFQEEYLPNLVLVDTTGLVNISKIPDAPRKTREMVERYIDEHRGHSHFVIVNDAKVRPSVSIGMDLLSSKNLAEQSLGVLTKCDTVKSERSEDTIDQTLQGLYDQANESQLRFGWYLTSSRNFDISGQQSQLKAADNEERGFFDAACPQLASAGVCSIASVCHAIHKAYSDSLKEVWAPSAFRLYEGEMVRLRGLNQQYGLPFVVTSRFPPKDAAVAHSQPGTATAAEMRAAILERACIILQETAPLFARTIEAWVGSVLANMRDVCTQLETARLGAGTERSAGYGATRLTAEAHALRKRFLLALANDPLLTALRQGSLLPNTACLRSALENDNSPLNMARFTGFLDQISQSLEHFLHAQAEPIAVFLQQQLDALEEQPTSVFEVRPVRSPSSLPSTAAPNTNVTAITTVASAEGELGTHPVSPGDVEFEIVCVEPLGSLVARMAQNIVLHFAVPIRSEPTMCLPPQSCIDIADTTTDQRLELVERERLLRDAVDSVAQLAGYNPMVKEALSCPFGVAEHRDEPDGSGIVATMARGPGVTVSLRSGDGHTTVDSLPLAHTVSQARQLRSRQQTDGTPGCHAVIDFGNECFVQASSFTIVSGVMANTQPCRFRLEAKDEDAWVVLGSFETPNGRQGPAFSTTSYHLGHQNRGKFFSRFRIVDESGQPFSLGLIEMYGTYWQRLCTRSDAAELLGQTV
eukprot:m.209854 g.209854  ORF g.209854 m.209854 type:complete len:937 (+) comp18548_c0_seq1:176-2986(+)